MLNGVNDRLNSKAAYAAPELTVYGSVRNLTGGSAGANNDGNGPMTETMV